MNHRNTGKNLQTFQMLQRHCFPTRMSRTEKHFRDYDAIRQICIEWNTAKRIKSVPATN